MTKANERIPMPANVRVEGNATPWRGGWWSYGAGLSSRANPYLRDPDKSAWLAGFNARKTQDSATAEATEKTP